MCWRVNRRENGGRLTADKRGVFRLFCLPAPACLVVSSRECSRPRVQQQTINGALPLRMTPPWPFSTSPHCASTEPCGDTHSLGRTRRFEIASPRFFFFHAAGAHTHCSNERGSFRFSWEWWCFMGIQWIDGLLAITNRKPVFFDRNTMKCFIRQHHACPVDLRNVYIPT